MLQRANVVALARPTATMPSGTAIITPAFASTKPGSSPGQQGTLVGATVRAGKFPPPEFFSAATAVV